MSKKDKNNNIVDTKNGYIEETLIIDRNSLILRDSSSGNIIDKEDIVSMLNDSANNSLPKAINVSIESTHSGTTKNFTEYLSAKMKASAKTWTNPYEKPVLREHQHSGATLGRVKSYKFRPSILNPEKDTIELGIEITDRDSIRRHLDGTALTYSIGAQAKQVYCSICGVDILNDDYCGHWRGRTYEKKIEGAKKPVKEVCIWQIGDLEYLEVSEVNIPADVWAQKLSVTVKEDESKDSLRDDSSEETGEVEDNLDSSNEGEELTDAADTSSSIDSNDSDSGNDVITLADSLLDSLNEDNISGISNSNIDNAIVDDTLSELNIAKDELAKAKADLVAAEAEIESVKASLTEAQQQITSITNTSKMTYNLNIDLAKSLKKVLAESIVDARSRLKRVDDAASGDYNTIVIKSLNELFSTYNELREADKARVSLPHITQRDVGDGGALSVHQSAVDVEDKPKTTKIALTANDAVNQIVNIKNKEE